LRTEAPLVAQLRDLVPGLDSIGSFAIPFARLPRLPRRLGAWADVASQTPQALLLRPCFCHVGGGITGPPHPGIAETAQCYLCFEVEEGNPRRHPQIDTAWWTRR
jgi:hypothetical protein